MTGKRANDLIIETILKWSPTGEKTLPNGVRLICPTPYIGTDAWLHVIFPALSVEKLDELQRKINMSLPTDFREFLLRFNGVMLFSNKLCIWGVRDTMTRTGDNAWQPYDLLDHNHESERPSGSPRNVIFFGTDDSGKSWCFFEINGRGYRIGRTDRHNFQPTAYSKDFSVWAVNAIRNLEGN